MICSVVVLVITILYGGVIVFHILLLVAVLQTARFSGTVADSVTKSPIQGASVRVVATASGTYSDHHGRFHLHPVVDQGVEGGQNKDSLRIAVSSVGYRTQTVTLRSGEPLIILLGKSDISLPAVVVTGNKEVPGQGFLPSTTLSAMDISEQRGQTIGDMLASLPGVAMLRTGASVVKPMIHGVTGQRLVTSNAGIAMEGQQWGDDHGLEVDPFTPMTLSVVKGPAAIHYGPGAMGGVVSVDPEALSVDSPLNGSATVNLFSNNKQGGIGARVEKGNLLDLPVAGRVFGGFRRAGNMYAPTYALANTGFEQGTVGAMIEFQADTAMIHARLYGTLYRGRLGVFSASHIGNLQDLQRAIESDTPLVAATSLYAIGNPEQSVLHSLLVAEVRSLIGFLGKILVRYGWQQNDRDEFDRHNKRVVGRGPDSVTRAKDSVERLHQLLTSPALSLRLSTYTLDAQLHHHALGPLRGSVGLNGLRQVNDRGGTVLLIPDYRQYGLGGFIHESMNVSDVLALDVGLRYDMRWLHAWPVVGSPPTTQKESRSYGSWSGSLGTLWTATDDVSVSTTLSYAWRPPAPNELYSNGVHHGAAQYEVGDNTLGVERVVGADVTGMFRVGKHTLEINVYGNLYHDYILLVPDALHPAVTVRGVFPKFLYQQTNAIIAGAELTTDTQISRVVAFTMRGAYTYGQDLIHREPLFRMPPSTLQIAVHVHDHDIMGLENVYAEFTGRSVFSQNRFVQGQDYADPPPTYTLFTIQFGGSAPWTQTQGEWSVTLRNLLNTRYRDYLSRYRYFADDAGFSIDLRYTHRFGD